MEQERDRLKHLLIILLEALSRSPEEGRSLPLRIHEQAEAAGLDEADVNGLLDWIESHWQPDGQPDWGDEDLPDAPSSGAFRYFGENDSECLSGAGLGYLLKLLNGGQINRAQLEALVQYASFMAVRPLEPEELDSILEQVIFRPGRPHMTGGSSEGFGSVH